MQYISFMHRALACVCAPHCPGRTYKSCSGHLDLVPPLSKHKPHFEQIRSTSQKVRPTTVELGRRRRCGFGERASCRMHHGGDRTFRNAKRDSRTRACVYVCHIVPGEDKKSCPGNSAFASTPRKHDPLASNSVDDVDVASGSMPHAAYMVVTTLLPSGESFPIKRKIETRRVSVCICACVCGARICTHQILQREEHKHIHKKKVQHACRMRRDAPLRWCAAACLTLSSYSTRDLVPTVDIQEIGKLEHVCVFGDCSTNTATHLAHTQQLSRGKSLCCGTRYAYAHVKHHRKTTEANKQHARCFSTSNSSRKLRHMHVFFLAREGVGGCGRGGGGGALQ